MRRAGTTSSLRERGYAQAIDHFDTALGLLESLPTGRDRDERELALQMARGWPLLALEGPAAPRVEAAYGRARDLCHELGDRPELVPALFGLSLFHAIRGRYRMAAELLERLLSLAGSIRDPGPGRAGRLLLGLACWEMGEHERALDLSRQALVGHDAGEDLSPAPVDGREGGIFDRSFAALALWHLGFPDRARKLACEGIEHAPVDADPYGAANASLLATCVRVLRGEAARPQRADGTAAPLATGSGAALLPDARRAGSGTEIGLPVSSESRAGAEASFLRAIGIARRNDARSFELRAVVSLARSFEAQGRTAEARTMLSETCDRFTEGFDTVDLRTARGLLESLREDADRTGARANAAEAENVFRREGDFWTLAYAGRSIRMKDARGIRLLAMLIRRRGEEIHATDLGEARRVEGAARAGAGGSEVAKRDDAGAILDARARSQYRRRIESLREELAEAEANADLGRSRRLGQEIDLLTQELSSAFGLGGRSRKAADNAERARKAVSSRVSDSISRIRREHPELGAHLANSVRLGLFCRYQPEKPVRWNV